MMENEIGIVKEITNNEVIIEFERSSACGKCGACMMAKDTGKMMIKIPYNKDIKAGDEVYIDIERKFYILSTFLLYVMPLVILIVTVILGSEFISGDNGQILTALLGIVLSFGSYFLLKLFKNKFLDMKEKSMTYFRVK